MGVESWLKGPNTWPLWSLPNAVPVKNRCQSTCGEVVLVDVEEGVPRPPPLPSALGFPIPRVIPFRTWLKLELFMVQVYVCIHIPSYPKTVKFVGFNVKPEVWKVNPMFWIFAILGILTLLHPAASKSAISSPTPAMLYGLRDPRPNSRAASVSGMGVEEIVIIRHMMIYVCACIYYIYLRVSNIVITSPDGSRIGTSENDGTHLKGTCPSHDVRRVLGP